MARTERYPDACETAQAKIWNPSFCRISSFVLLALFFRWLLQNHFACFMLKQRDPCVSDSPQACNQADLIQKIARLLFFDIPWDTIKKRTFVNVGFQRRFHGMGSRKGRENFALAGLPAIHMRWSGSQTPPRVGYKPMNGNTMERHGMTAWYIQHRAFRSLVLESGWPTR